MKFFLLLGFLISLGLGVAVFPVAAQEAGLAIPVGFTPLFVRDGIKLYWRVDADTQSKEFVQMINLQTGARLELLHGPIVEAGAGEGIYGGNNPLFERQYLETAWEIRSAQGPPVFCLTNGQFFVDMIRGHRVNPTVLSFPLKKDGTMVSEGYSRYQFFGQRQMLELWSDYARITPLSERALLQSTAPDAIVGLAAQAPVRSSESLGRTFVGTADGNGDGWNEIVLIYTAETVPQPQAVTILRAFGAGEVMMLDGGGSTQLMCRGEGYISQSRPLPQILASVPATDHGRAVLAEHHSLLSACCTRERRR